MSETNQQLPTFDWSEPVEETLEQIHAALSTYNPTSNRFASLLYNLLLDLATHVEREVSGVYINRLIEDAQESSLETVKFMTMLIQRKRDLTTVQVEEDE